LSSEHVPLRSTFVGLHQRLSHSWTHLRQLLHEPESNLCIRFADWRPGVAFDHEVPVETSAKKRIDYTSVDEKL
jgi:hypothetical protein